MHQVRRGRILHRYKEKMIPIKALTGKKNLLILNFKKKSQYKLK